MRRFIQEEDLFIVKMSRIAGSCTDYYDQFTPETEKCFREQMEALRQEFLHAARNGTLAGDKFLFALFARYTRS